MVYKDEEPGQFEVLGDRYQLQSRIGSGGMATIHRARDLKMDRDVAVKVLRETFNTDPKFVARFQREARTASALKHPNIVQVYDYGQYDGNYYIVMELIEGTDLRSYLRSHTVLDVDHAMFIAHDIALGLGAAHRRGIVHRDVKPQNVLIGVDGSIKLTDFGIVSLNKDANAERLTTSGMTLGTVQYFAPEQAQGEIVTPAADVYGLGIVMYEMLTGNPPFDGNSAVIVAMQHIQDKPEPPGQLNPDIPASLEKIILRCLEKKPGARFPDGSQLARALEKLGDVKTGEIASIIPENLPISTSSTQSPTRLSNNGQSDTLKIVRLSVSSNANEINPGASSNHNRKGKVPAIVARHFMPHRTHWSFKSIITISIVLTILFLSGCSVYLANQLHFIHIPFFTASVTTTSPSTGFIEVPDLHTMSWLHAVAVSEKSGFRLVFEGGQQDGVVVDQNPRAHDKALKGSTIDVKLEILTPKIGLQLRNPP
ncbi:MAG: protein kinase domain-containing protein [Ktedonobacteraceae bacterium]